MAKTYSVMKFDTSGRYETHADGLSRQEASETIVKVAQQYQGVVAVIDNETGEAIVTEVYYHGKKLEPAFIHTILHSLGRFL
jgi:hypothetical protein